MTKYERRIFFERLVALRVAYRAAEHPAGVYSIDEVIGDAECRMADAEVFVSAVRRDIAPAESKGAA
jgi:hypothetical protein